MWPGSDVFNDIISFLVIWRVFKFLVSGVCRNKLKAYWKVTCTYIGVIEGYSFCSSKTNSWSTLLL